MESGGDSRDDEGCGGGCVGGIGCIVEKEFGNISFLLQEWVPS